MAARSITAALGAVLCAFAAVCGPAVAARPVASGHYYGFEADETRPFSVLSVDAQLRVSPDRRRLRAGSYVKLAASCPGRRADPAFTVKLARERVRHDGVFSASGSRSGLGYRLVGQFRSKGYAQVRYGFSRCKASRFPVTLYLDGEPPFSGCRRQRAETLASSSSGRVFERYRLERSGEFFPYVYGCLNGGGPVLLGRNYDEETIERPVVAGGLAAYASVGCGLGACNAAIMRSGSASRARLS